MPQTNPRLFSNQARYFTFSIRSLRIKPNELTDLESCQFAPLKIRLPTQYEQAQDKNYLDMEVYESGRQLNVYKFMKTKYALLLFALTFISFTGQDALADKVCRPAPFNCNYLNISHKHCSYRPGYGNVQCVDLDNHGFRALRDFDSRYAGGWNQTNWGGYPGPGYHGPVWDRPRDNHNHDYNNGYNHPRGSYSWPRGNGWGPPPRRNDPGAYDDRYGYRPGDCPSGYHVNERKCTDDERRRGCSDLRSPSGQTCVGWGVRRR